MLQRTTTRPGAGGIVAVLLLVAATTILLARTWTVDDDGPADFALIQAAIDAAAPGDVVVVRPGTYFENLVFKCGVTVRGDDAAVTTVDGGMLGPVATITGCDATTMLEGLRITNGLSLSGGGIRVEGGAPIIRRAIVVGNQALDPAGVYYGYGGGIALVDSDAEITMSLIEGNEASATGGGIDIYDGSPRVSGNEVRGNSASGEIGTGGGISSILNFLGDRAVIHGNRIVSNTATFGGGIQITGTGVAIVTSNEIIGNVTSSPGISYGGGMEVYYGGAQVVNNTFAGNVSDLGGGVSLYTTSNPLVRNNILYGNRAHQDGGGMYVHAAGAQVLSNLFHQNNGGDCSGLDAALCNDPSNLIADPRFVNATADDYRLLPGSPAIDSGDPGSAPVLDVRGQQRPLDGNSDLVATFDRGAWEYDRDEVLGLRFTGPTSFTWMAQPGATLYHVYSGLLSTLSTSGVDTCRDPDDPAPGDLLFSDATTPAPGNGYAYLVTAEIGGTERSPGFNSAGIERTLPLPCP